MDRRALVMVSGILAGALTVLVCAGIRVVERDRDRLFASYAREQQQAITETARGIGGELADIGEDLELASTLLQGASSYQFAERELHAIATIKREYMAAYARDDDGRTTTVTAYNAPVGLTATADKTVQELLESAAKHPGVLHVSNMFATSGDSAACRVFARRPKDRGPVVAVVVDMGLLLGRLKLQRDPLTRAVVRDASGQAAATSDPVLARALDQEPALRSLLAADTPRSMVIDAKLAGAIGLPASNAVAISVPFAVSDGTPWRLVVVASARSLQTQEKTIARRVVVGGALVLVLLVSAAAYVLHTTFRARALRERVRHAEHLAHSEKLVTAGQLAAGIAHEVGTPLNVARGRVELALSHLGPDHPEASNHRIVIDQIDRVTRLIQQLLEYVRPSGATTQSVDLARAVHDVRDLLAPQAAKRKVSLHVDAFPDAATLRTDPDQVQQIVLNLILNAIDACSSGGAVTVRAAVNRKDVTLEIVDNGHGIRPELQKQVFDPFFTTKKRGQGTGLGLWVVAQLVRAQSGEIQLESTPGRGTTVRVIWATDV